MLNYFDPTIKFKIKGPQERFITKKDKEEAKRFLKNFNIRLKFKRFGWSTACLDDRIIIIDLRESRTIQEFLSLLFHELGHFYCDENNLYEIYHKENIPPKDYKVYIRKMGLKAERFVDKKGKDLLNFYVDKIDFIETYKTKEAIEFYRKWVEENY